MKLLQRGREDALIQELWFIGWLGAAVVGGFLTSGWGGGLLVLGTVLAVRAERSL